VAALALTLLAACAGLPHSLASFGPVSSQDGRCFLRSALLNDMSMKNSKRLLF
jgi:hypothetical protein